MGRVWMKVGLAVASHASAEMCDSLLTFQQDSHAGVDAFKGLQDVSSKFTVLASVENVKGLLERLVVKASPQERSRAGSSAAEAQLPRETVFVQQSSHGRLLTAKTRAAAPAPRPESHRIVRVARQIAALAGQLSSKLVKRTGPMREVLEMRANFDPRQPPLMTAMTPAKAKSLLGDEESSATSASILDDPLTDFITGFNTFVAEKPWQVDPQVVDPLEYWRGELQNGCSARKTLADFAVR